MKRILTIILLFLAITVNAATLIDGIYYNLDNTALTAEVTYEYGHQYSGSISIPATVAYKNKSYKVTSIGNSAFNDCSDLTSIDIPDGVTRIGGWCFAYCSNLRKIRMPKTLRAIGEDAFWDCDSLKTVDIGDLSNWCTIDFQGSLWFSNPISGNNLEHLLVDGIEVTDLVIPDDVEEISRKAFYWCSAIRSLEIPGTVKTIGEDAFCSSFNITRVILHEGIKHIMKGGLANIEVSTITIPKREYEGQEL